MTDLEIRIEVAERCGWKADSAGDYHNAKIYHSGFPNGYVRRFDLLTFGEGVTATHKWYDRWLDCAYIPNYPEDLNAMAEARKTLTEDQMEAYHDNLHEATSLNHDGENDKVATMLMVSATARQHAEAFLRTLNKHQDQP